MCELIMSYYGEAKFVVGMQTLVNLGCVHVQGNGAGERETDEVGRTSLPG